MQLNQVENSILHTMPLVMRAAWMAQELLTTFEQELHSVSLQPNTGGIFDVRLNGVVIFSRKEAGRFPESKELKQLIRDVISQSDILDIATVKLQILKQTNSGLMIVAIENANGLQFCKAFLFQLK